MTESIFPIPDIYKAKRILCIEPHYDDNDIAAGGCLARLHDSGAEIFYLMVTDAVVGVIDPNLSSEEASAQIKREQDEAGALIGVSKQIRLDYPDAGKYDYFDVRRDIIKYIRLLRPDLLFAPDPWLPNEAHRDHVITGQAAAEAAVMYAFMRLATDPQVDAAYQPHELLGIAFYYTLTPNTFVDNSSTRERKERALRCYKAHYAPGDTERLLWLLDLKEREYARERGFSHAEAFKVLHTFHLHCGII